MKPVRNVPVIGLRTVRSNAASVADGRRRLSALFAAGAAFAALSAAPTAKAVNVVGDANAETTISPSNAVIKMTQSGTLTVTEPGEIEILLVGGGGGGGANYVESSKTYYGGGGGAGGVIHKTAFQVAAGEWDVTIGAGGAVGANGGKTTAFGMTAWGGGRGAKGAGLYDALSGASGGGGARYYFNDQNDGRTGYKGAPAKSEYVNDYFNLGNAGSSAANEACMSGHGGGAGGAAAWNAPGAAYRCSITGADVAYAGGGGGYAWNVITGVGGGKNSFGGGGNMNDVGGLGVVIVRFTRTVAKTETAFDDATGGTVTTCRVDGVKYQVHTFAQSGQFAIPHHGHVEVLVVGGGGGGGASVTRSGEKSHNNTSVFYGGGGGAGGVIHKTEFFLTNGVYDIVVGAGGAANVGDSLTYVRGGDTRAFGLTAFGGGCGAKGYALTAPRSGASGGGGAQTWWQGESVKSKGAVPEAAYTNAPYFNLGNKGGNAMNDAGTGGGGGGAGGAASGTRGGAAYVCSITGADVAYAGGGGGYYWGVKSVAGGGSGSYGGGGNSNGAGGGGVVIIRHPLPKRDATIITFR